MGLLATLRSTFLGAPTPADLYTAEQAERRRQLALAFPMELAAVTDPQTAGYVGTRHPIVQLTEQAEASGHAHQTRLLVLHVMRRYYPTLDAAIKLRRVLEGECYPVSEDSGLQTALREVWEDIAVGYTLGAGTLRGGNAYLDTLAETADDYGLAAGEIVMNAEGTAVERLVVPNGRTLSLDHITEAEAREHGVAYDPRYRRLVQTDSRGRTPLAGPLIQTLAFRTAQETAYPEALAWTLTQTTEAVLRMFQSVNQAWWRFGDPSMLLGLEFDKEATPETEQVGDVEVPSELVLFKNTVEAVMQARRQGKVGDAYFAGVGAKVVNQVLGQVDATLMRYFREQASAFDAYLVPLSDVPVWLFPTVERASDGLGGALSQNQAAIATTGAHKRNRAKRQLGKDALDMVLLAEGSARYQRRYEMESTEVNVLDEKLIAETRRTEAEAVAKEIENATQLFEDDGTPRFSGDALAYLEELEVV